MKLISSSFFGRLFGNSTNLIINNDVLCITVNNVTSEVTWQALNTPPVFTKGLLGVTVLLNTSDKTFVLSKLAYDAEKNHKTYCQEMWIASNKTRLVTLLAKIDHFIKSGYLRHSRIVSIKTAIQSEYHRWYPWISDSEVFKSVKGSVQQLSEYQCWKIREVESHREFYISKQLNLYKTFFDNVESNPLTLMQRRACIIDDDNNLLLAGAGTGKTSVMVGRTGYLLNSKQASENDILLLAYGKKAADEMNGRIKDKLLVQTIKATTFHSLGLYIISQVEGGKPNLTGFVDDEKAKAKWVQTCFEDLITTHTKYRHLVLEYFSHYYYLEKNDFEFKTLGEYYQYLTDNDIRSLKGDKVKSFTELHIANWLFSHGIEYQYEANYIIDIKTADRKQYQPDFFLPELNLYIEYYGVDENGNTAPYIDKQEYHFGIQWKADIHKLNKSQCITLTYADHKNGRLISLLEKQVKAFTRDITKVSDDVLLSHLQEAGRITVLAEVFAKLVGLYKAACLNDDLEREVIANSADSKQTEKALQLLSPILDCYQEMLSENNEIDFEDMINKSLSYINSGQFSSPWRFIMVDEFQDISEPRARLVKALRDNNKGSSVFAVGDDWQAIYRFSGADVSLTTGFENYFGRTTQTELDQTFRFNNKIGEVATEFVSKNPTQIDKNIKSLKQVTTPAVSILRKAADGYSTKNDVVIDEISNGAMFEVLSAISSRVNKVSTVYLLARFWFQLPNKSALSALKNSHPMLRIETHTFHASKGKEADYVVIVGLKSGKHGFPSSKATPSLVDALLAKQENFEHAEERRLFYVALTRAKDRVYIIVDMANSSEFVKELVDHHDVDLNEFGFTVNQALVDHIKCLVCETGILTPRTGKFGPFYSCSHFPRCDHNERACEKCTSAMSKSTYPGFKTCLNVDCLQMLPVCDKCGAEMVLRKSARGEFWGCRNYKGNDVLSCKHGIDKALIRWPKLAK